MGFNINQLPTAASNILPTDKLYLGRSPFDVTDDRYLLGSAVLAQFNCIFALSGTNVVVGSATPATVQALAVPAGALTAIGFYAEYEMLGRVTTPSGTDAILINPQYNAGSVVSFNASTSWPVPSTPSTYYDIIVRMKVTVISPLSGGNCTYAFKYKINVLDPTSPGASVFLYTGSAYRNTTTFGTGVTFQVAINPGASSVINAESAKLIGGL